METKVKGLGTRALALLLATVIPVSAISAEENAKPSDGTGSAEINLRKTLGAREYQGNRIEGEEREVRNGDTMWHILVREKGLAGDRFQEYFVLVRGLNPQLKTPEALRVGDKIFIPLKPDQVLALQNSTLPAPSAERPAAPSGKTQDYTVKAGEHLYQIIRNRLGVTDDQKVWQYFALVKDLNPQKKDWDIIEQGETIRLPVHGKDSDGKFAIAKTVTATAPTMDRAEAAPSAGFGLDYAERLSARENFALISLVAESLGNEIQRSGEEVVALQDGAIRLDKNQFPVVYNKALEQRVILDGESNIPDSLRANLRQSSANTPVVSLAKNTTVQEAVGQLLARLGYQPLPGDRPVVIQEAGVSLEAKGQWAVMAPQQSNKPQEIIVINLADASGAVPDDLKKHLAEKGLHLKNIPVGESSARGENNEKSVAPERQMKTLPAEKSTLIDALLNTYQVNYKAESTLAANLHSGLNAEITADRMFETGGRKVALFFRAIDPAIKTALESKHGMKVVELDFAALKSREIAAKLLVELGEKSIYKEHRFAAAKGSLKDRLTISAAGFLLSERSLFMTDREIPARFQPIFFEKGLDIVYFQ
jgi:hypothetical protein